MNGQKFYRYCLFLVLIIGSPINAISQTITVGAKNFNEGYLLSEILSQLLEENGFNIDRKFNLGGTLICFEALKNSSQKPCIVH